MHGAVVQDLAGFGRTGRGEPGSEPQGPVPPRRLVSKEPTFVRPRRLFFVEQRPAKQLDGERERARSSFCGADVGQGNADLPHAQAGRAPDRLGGERRSKLSDHHTKAKSRFGMRSSGAAGLRPVSIDAGTAHSALYRAVQPEKVCVLRRGYCLHRKSYHRPCHSEVRARSPSARPHAICVTAPQTLAAMSNPDACESNSGRIFRATTRRADFPTSTRRGV